MPKKQTAKKPTKTSVPAITIPSNEQEVMMMKLEQDRELWNYLLGTENSNKLTDIQKMNFIMTAKAQNLNPLKREVYAIPFEVKEYSHVERKKVPTGRYDLAVITGFEVYLKRAQRDPGYNGYEVRTERQRVEDLDKDGYVIKDSNGIAKEKVEIVAVCTIFRKGKPDFVHEVFLSEYKQNNSMWNFQYGKPRTMIKKVVIAQAHRLCYTDETDGLPYIYEEHPELMNQYTNPPQQIADNPVPIGVNPIPIGVGEDSKKEPVDGEKQVNENLKIACEILGWDIKKKSGMNKLKSFVVGIFPHCKVVKNLGFQEKEILVKHLGSLIDEQNEKDLKNETKPKE